MLGINKNATDDEIKKAYKVMAKKYHPDLNKTPEAAEKMKEINAAYDVLKDPEKRARYDQFGDENFGGGNPNYGKGGPSAEDIFSGFGGFGGGMEDILRNFFGGQA